MARTPSGITQKNEHLIKLLDEALEDNGWILPLANDDMIDLEIEVNDRLKEIYKRDNIQPYTIGVSSLRRLFRKEKYDKSFEIQSTLNPLAKLAGYESWGYYLKENNITISAEMLSVDEFDDAEDLKIGRSVRMGWYPTRYVDLEYLGDCEFKIVKYVGTGSDRTGDVIAARWFDVVDIPADSGRPDVVQDIAGVIGETYDRLKL